MSAPAGPPPAGFWRRYAAWSLDWLLLAAPLALLLAPLCTRAWRQLLSMHRLLEEWTYARIVAAEERMPSPLAMTWELLSDPALSRILHAGSLDLALTLAQALLIAFGLSALYFVAFESSRWQATPGKRALRLRVRAMDAGDVGAMRALWRHLGGALSWAMLNLGHAIAGWRRDRRALHDLLAGTQVLAEGAMPRWARAWLWLQALALAALFLGGLFWLGSLLLQLAQL